MFSSVKCLISTGLRVVREYGSNTGSYETYIFNRRTKGKICYFLESQHLNNQEKYLRFSVHVRVIHKEANTSLIRGCNLIIVLGKSVLKSRSGELMAKKKNICFGYLSNKMNIYVQILSQESEGGGFK